MFKLTLYYCHIREISLTTLLYLVPRGDLLVALLDAGAGQGGEELRLPDTVGEVVHSSPVAAQTWTVDIELVVKVSQTFAVIFTSRSGVYAEQTARLHRAAVRVEVHVSQLQDCPRPD